MSAVVIAIPHASAALPSEVAAAVLPHVDALLLRANSDVDTDLVYALPNVRNVINPWSRFVADPNRAERQKSDGGVVPVSDFDERLLYAEARLPDPRERQRRIIAYHRTYHAQVAHAVADPRTRFFLDGHSMTAMGPARAPDSGRRRPDATLSNMGDEEGNPTPGLAYLTCPPAVTRAAQESLARLLRDEPAPDAGPRAEPSGEVRINDPFFAGYGVRKHARPSRGVPGMQIELNQRLWVDERTWEPLPGRVEWIQRVLTTWVDELLGLLDGP
jgi:N-formylglutamate amidohydrolase